MPDLNPTPGKIQTLKKTRVQQAKASKNLKTKMPGDAAASVLEPST
jgi:hypothetical protein